MGSTVVYNNGNAHLIEYVILIGVVHVTHTRTLSYGIQGAAGKSYSCDLESFWEPRTRSLYAVIWL